MKKNKIFLEDICDPSIQMADIEPEKLMPLPYPYDTPEAQPAIKRLTDDQKARYESDLDGFLALKIPKPETKEEEEQLVKKFLEGLKKLLSRENNWTFLMPLMMSLEYCAKCQTCNDACPVYVASGKQEIYRPTYRSEVLRKIINKYIKPGGKAFAKFTGNEIDLNWKTVARLAELAYRCTLCRRCAQACPIGVDNGLITHELRKLFSQEMGIAPEELHKKGSVQQLEVGSSTGMSRQAFKDIIEFLEEEIEEKTGKKITIPVDKKGADILLIHNAGEFLSWPENPSAFAIIFEEAGLNWTLSSEIAGYDAVNYGVWYDDAQLARVAVRHAKIAKDLGVKKIVVGECGHAHKALMVIADRVLNEDLNIPRESCLPLLEDIVINGKLKLDPQKNNFPVTLHDPCNIVRLMGIVEPQRKILRKIAPQFREMAPEGVKNYCCGGGAGFAIMPSLNMPDWRSSVSSRMKFKQILEVFQDVIDPGIRKMVCAPCSNCKGAIRDLLEYYDAWEKTGIAYTGLVDLIVNAMVDIEGPFIEWPDEM
ncbi:MAG TPA: (Fe-S)-binding protein [Syntrophales bacterium]|nr:(Fe-S)-binding protein [Syntrophales bacterium]HPQ45013.1 (Fe-S)-binding protein [Syntrophales bacterium]